MIIVEAEAVAAARAYADSRSYPAWREGSVHSMRIVVEGIDCWRVMADDEPRPGNTWLDEEVDGGQSYLVDAITGKCVGTVAFGRYRLFRSERDGHRR